MQRLYPIFYLLISYFTLSAQTPDFQTDHFYPKWGAKNITSPTDIQASASVYSDGERIHIEVNVVDDILVNNADVLHTDHVEVWFGMPLYEIMDTSWYFSEQYNAKHYFEKANLPKRHYCIYPKKTNSWLDLPMPKVMLYDHFQYTGCMKFQKDLSCYRCNTLQTSNDFSGMTHFGLYMDNRPVHLMDRENYFLFEKATGYTVGDLTQGCKYQSELTANGYKVSATFDAIALGFVTLPDISHLRIMIDVVDVDATGKQESLLSSATNRKWGNFTTFNTIKFKKPIQTNYTYLPSNFLIHKIIQPQFMVYSDEGWKSYNLVIGQDGCRATSDSACEAYIHTYNYFPTYLHYEEKTVANTSIRIGSFRRYNNYTLESNHETSITGISGGSYTFYNVNDDFLYTYQGYVGKYSNLWIDDDHNPYLYAKSLKKEFAFKNGVVGIISPNISGGMAPHSGGGCLWFECYVHRYYQGKFEEVLKIDDAHCRQWKTIINDLQYQNVAIKQIVWQKLGKELKIITDSEWIEPKNECHPSAIYITFNNDGSLQEIYPLPETE